ncbi:MAG: hypothetical protein OEO23_07215 [Gemmatimonadota bacterium]|nr:hypothetical protein [Gemmatimonadota bacterium]
MRRLLPFVILTLLACSEGDTVSGGPAGLDGPDAPISLSSEHLFTVGAVDGDRWDVFGRVASVAFDQAGNLYILDGDAVRIAVVDPSGNLIRTVGKRGGGPGEFQMPFAFVPLSRGALAVFDLGKQGFQLFDPEGAFMESVSVDLSAGAPGTEMAVLPDGRLVSANGIQVSFGGPGADGDEQDEAGRPVHRFSLEGGGQDVLYRGWEPPLPESGFSESLEGDGGSRIDFTMRSVAYEPQLFFGVLSSGHVAVVDSTGYRVKLVDSSGAVSEVLERPVEPQAVDDRIRAAETERRLAAVDNQGTGRVMVIGGNGAGGMSIDQERMREMMRSQVESMTFSDVVPVISSLAVDGYDRIWVQRYGPLGEAEGPIDLLGAGGVYHGTLEAGSVVVPEAFGPDGLMAFVEEDELGVQTVRVARMAPVS